MTLTEVIAELKRSGLLDRAAHIRAGDVEVQLGPPMFVGPPEKQVTIQDEQEALHETLYASSRGYIPGAPQ